MAKILTPEAKASALAYFADQKRELELDHCMALNQGGTYDHTLVLRMRFPNVKNRDEMYESILKFQEV